jgi:hypothetical protein
MKKSDREFNKKYESIFESDRSELEKIVEAFDLVTKHYKSYGENEIELLKAVNDKENLVKEQIKMGMVDLIRGMYNECHRRATGRKAWNE